MITESLQQNLNKKGKKTWKKVIIISILLLYVIAIIFEIYFILYGKREVKNKEKSGYMLIVGNTILLLMTIIIGATEYRIILPKLL